MEVSKKMRVPQDGLFPNGKSICKWMIWGEPPISGNHHIIIFPGFGCCWYHWRKVSALPVLVVEPHCSCS